MQVVNIKISNIHKCQLTEVREVFSVCLCLCAIYATCICVYMQKMFLCIYVHSTCIYLAKTFRKIKLIIANEEIVCTETDHVCMCTHRHNTRFCMLPCKPRDYFFPMFLFESWPCSTLGNNTGFPLDSSQSVKEKSIWKAPAYRRSYNTTRISGFGITSVNRRLIYWKYLALICISESSK